MRRSDKEITAIMEKAAVCRIALADGDSPYVISVNFVYRDYHLYFHSAQEGRKIDVLRKNNQVCFEADTDIAIVRGDKPCLWGTKYRSVVGFGRAFFLEDAAAKKTALNRLMEKYAGQRLPAYDYNEDAFNKVLVIDIRIENMTGKKSGYK
jgi:nitroimidazol reductase NimA-like FMN-containing flavoprotein (pyridoxamine 5'-phosphate oxidase superfamily)